MLSIFSITSSDQGKLFGKSKNEADYFARHASAAAKAERAADQTAQNGGFLALFWAGIWTRAPRQELSD